MRAQCVVPVVLGGLMAATAATGGSQPVTVSPGDPLKLVLVGDRCPTFSWGQVDGARSLELVVYRVGDESIAAGAVLRQRLPGTATGWTPSLDRCLERGGRYAWSVRAVGRETVTDWSPPSLFQVAAGPSELELHQALAVVQRYVERREAAEVDEAAGTHADGAPGREAPAPAPEPRAVAATQLTVDGGIEAASIVADGSGLTNVTAADLVGDACVSLLELAFDPATQPEMDAHAESVAAHHPPTVDTTCHGAACDGTSFTNVQWSNLGGLPGGFADSVDDACTVRDNGDGTVTVACDDGTSLTWRPAVRGLQVSAGRSHTCGLLSNRAVACWGEDSNAQSSAPADTFTQVSAGDYHTCAVNAGGLVACWGDNTDWQSSPPTDTFTQVSAGYNHTCGVRIGGLVACWGGDAAGQSQPPGDTFTQVSAGGGHTCGVKTEADGVLACWGENIHGESSPPAGTFIQVSAGDYHTCGVMTDGAVACWGDNTDGQSSPPVGTFVQVSAGGLHSCGVETRGVVTCWGANDYGQSSPPAGDFTQVSAGSVHTCGVKTDGAVACWGWDDDSQATPPAWLR